MGGVIDHMLGCPLSPAAGRPVLVLFVPVPPPRTIPPRPPLDAGSIAITAIVAAPGPVPPLRPFAPRLLCPVDLAVPVRAGAFPLSRPRAVRACPFTSIIPSAWAVSFPSTLPIPPPSRIRRLRRLRLPIARAHRRPQRTREHAAPTAAGPCARVALGARAARVIPACAASSIMVCPCTATRARTR